MALKTAYQAHKTELDATAKRVIYTGCIDAYYGYRFGALSYRSLRFETRWFNVPNYQGNAVVNYTDAETPYTRSIEHKHFTFGQQPHTIVSWEYSAEWEPGGEPYYPVNDAANQTLYARYAALGADEPCITFCGRLAQYRYCDMDKAMETAMETARRLLEQKR